MFCLNKYIGNQVERTDVIRVESDHKDYVQKINTKGKVLIDEQGYKIIGQDAELRQSEYYCWFYLSLCFFQYVSHSFSIMFAISLLFAKSSKRMHTWFTNTKLYKDNLEDYVTKKAMTRQAKVRVMTTITLLMCIGLVTMGLKGIVTGCVVLGIIWVFHVVYFLFGVKTI